MAVLTFLLVMFQASPDSTAEGLGWQGNVYLQNNQLPEAQSAYERGLGAYADGRSLDPVYHGLQNNLGLALHGQGAYEEAQQAFGAALASAEGAEDITRATYNAGNSAFGAQALDDALARYREALLADPTNQDARFNYEFVKRQQQQQQQQDPSGDDEEQQEQQDQQQQDQQDGEPDDQENQEQQEEEGEQQNQDEQSQPNQGEEEEQQAEPDPTPLSRDEAERILQALENEEKELLREVQKMEGRPRRVTKDW